MTLTVGSSCGLFVFIFEFERNVKLKNLVQLNDLLISRNDRSQLALLNNLHLYEIRRKQVSTLIDLKNTILCEVQYKFLEQYCETQNQSASNLTTRDSNIHFGKYIYQDGIDKKVYILLKCWNSLVIIKREAKRFVLHSEYEHVKSFKICKGPAYQVMLEINFFNGRSDIKTNFQDNPPPMHTDGSSKHCSKDMTSGIRIKQAELLIHKAVTKKDFARIKSMNVFGNNILRTPNLEEMQILSKGGDAWIKVSANDDVVIGVPMVNNCSTRLTVLRNLRAVLDMEGKPSFSFEFMLYQLTTDLEEVDSVTNFFKNEHIHNQVWSSWNECNHLSLLPESFCVLVIKLCLSDLIAFDNLYHQLFVFYDILASQKMFTQRCFISTLSFRDIFENNLYKISFKESQLHRDLLAVVATTYRASIRLLHDCRLESMENYLTEKLNFVKVSNGQSSVEPMCIDGEYESDNHAKQTILFYNKLPDCVWHGTLIIINLTNDTISKFTIHSKTPEKSKVFRRLLQAELHLTENMSSSGLSDATMTANAVQFEGALRRECELRLHFISQNTSAISVQEKVNLYTELYQRELNTDVLFKKCS